MPAELIESELFGHEKGAFTGAAARHAGKFEQAHRGTLFLDEIGDMPLTMQAKLLRVLEEGEVERVGGDRPMQVDVRVVVATHRNSEELVKQGSVSPGSVSSRLRLPDVAAAAARAAGGYSARWWNISRKQVAEQNGWKPHAFARRRSTELQRYSWPGNVRELRNVVERLMLLSEDGRWTAGSRS